MKTYVAAAAAGLCLATPALAQSYQQMDQQVGCDSKYSDDKKEAIFDQNYKDHTFTWSGTVERVSGGDVAVKVLPDTFSYDFAVKLADESAAFTRAAPQTSIEVHFGVRLRHDPFGSERPSDATFRTKHERTPERRCSRCDALALPSITLPLTVQTITKP